MTLSRTLIAAFLALAGLSTIATADIQGERSRSGPLGDSSANSTTTRTENGRQTVVSGTGPRGTDYNRTVNVVRDPATGTRARTSSGSSASGATWGGTRTGTCNNGVCQSNGRFTNPSGGVTTTQGSTQRLSPGNWQSNRRWTGPRGRSGDVRRTWRRVR